ncbi:MAG: PaaI family thioesterase [candidate division Zixibacteria bacterium]|nr:PaaI family thioesterase [candidate division Zixibacteria bacterium]
MKEIIKYSGCFICGDLNNSGVKARFYYDGDKAFTEITADILFEGYKGIFHGGVMAGLLDEVMVKALLARGIYVMTAEMTTNYLLPVKTGASLTITGKVIEERGRLFLCEANAVGKDSKVYAKATGKYLRVKNHLHELLLHSID